MRNDAAELTRRPATDADLPLIYAILRAALGPYVEQTWGHCRSCLCQKTSDAEVRLVRLFILPAFQNRGFGTRVLREVLAVADEQRLPTRPSACTSDTVSSWRTRTRRTTRWSVPHHLRMQGNWPAGEVLVNREPARPLIALKL